EVRLANADLPKDKAGAIWQAMVEARRNAAAAAAARPGTDPAAAAPSGLVAEPELSAVATQYGFDAAGAGQALAANAGVANRLNGELSRRMIEQTLRLLALVDRPAAPADAIAAAGQAVAALQDHWWVEVNKGGRWLGLDL